jgi:hypothetical protein
MPAEVRAMLAAGWTVKTDTSGGAEDLDYLLSLGQCFKIFDESGMVLAAYILKINGVELWIALGAGRADIDLTAVGLALIEAQGREFDSIGFKTRRRGLVKKAAKHGYRVDACKDGIYTLRKRIK